MPHPKTDQIIELRKQGLSFGEISEKLDVSKSIASKACKGVEVLPEHKEAIKRRGNSRAAVSRTKETPTHKYCPTCERTLPKTEFHKRGKHLMGYCKECQCAYVNLKKKEVREYLREIINSSKDRPCQDCGHTHPPFAMDFDHRDPKEKKFNIGGVSKLYWVTEDILREEIAKCDVVCAMCHRYRTFGVRRSG